MSSNAVLDIRVLAALKKLRDSRQSIKILNTKMEDINTQLKENIRIQKSVNHILSQQNLAFARAIQCDADKRASVPKVKLRIVPKASNYD